MRTKLRDDGTKQVRFAVNDTFYLHATKAIHLDSMAHHRFSTIRMIIVCGLHHTVQVPDMARFLWLKQLARTPLGGGFGVNIVFKGDDVTLFDEARQLLSKQSLEPVTGFDTVCVALLAALAFLDDD